jgi:hypothetical protein
MVIMTVGENMTTAVTRTEDVGMTATVMREAGVSTGPMAIEKEFMPRRRFSFHRLDRRVSTFSYHQSFFVPE